jgi:hypothetical protein
MFINGKEFLTVKNMAEKLGKETSAVKSLLFRYGIEPISRDALYSIEAFNAIKDAPGKGRPKKAATPNKPASKKTK